MSDAESFSTDISADSGVKLNFKFNRNNKRGKMDERSKDSCLCCENSLEILKGSCTLKDAINKGEEKRLENSKINTIRIVPLHKCWNYLEGCHSLLQSEWPTKGDWRRNKLRQSQNFFPTSLVLVLKTSEDLEYVVGHARVNPIKGIEEACFIESVVIAKKFRGRGWGRFLMSEAEGYMVRRGISVAYLTTKDKEIFYNKLGYVQSEPLTMFGTLSKNKNQLFIKNVFPDLDIDCRTDTGKSYPLYEAEASSSHSTSSCSAIPIPPPLPGVLNSRLKLIHTEFGPSSDIPKVTMKKLFYPESAYCYGEPKIVLPF